MGNIRTVRVQLVEPFGVPEIYYTGIGAVRPVGDGLVEFVLYRLAAPVEHDGPPEKRIVGRIIRPIASISDDIKKITASLGPIPIPIRPARVV